LLNFVLQFCQPCFSLHGDLLFLRAHRPGRQ
jgi:hypothetical protein